MWNPAGARHRTGTTVSSTAAVSPTFSQNQARTTAAALTLLSAGHFAIDLYAAALAAVQPTLVDKLHLSLTQAGILGGLLITSSSVAQPLYGYLADRFHSRMFTVLAPAVAGIFLSALCLAPNFGWLLLLVVLAAPNEAWPWRTRKSRPMSVIVKGRPPDALSPP